MHSMSSELVFIYTVRIFSISISGEGGMDKGSGEVKKRRSTQWRFETELRSWDSYVCRHPLVATTAQQLMPFGQFRKA